MRRAWPIVLCPVLLSFLVACSSTEVRSEKDPNTNLSQYHTFSWEPSNQLEQPRQFSARRDDILDEQIRSEVDKDLSRKGLARVSENGDLRVAYAVRTKDNVQVEPGFYPAGTYPYWWGSQPIDQVVLQKQGTLALDLIDAKTGRVVWRGIGVTDIGKTGASMEQIRDLTNDILQKLPQKTAIG